MRDSKGIGYLAELLSRPGTEHAALELQAISSASGGSLRKLYHDAALCSENDLGPVLDARAKTQYRDRLAELETDWQQATHFHDLERVARARAEYDQLVAALAAAMGRGRRDRRAGSPDERARVNVTRAIRGTIRRLARHDRSLADHLAATVLTGRLCVYRPERSRPVQWHVNTRRSAAAGTSRFTAPKTEYAQSDGVSIAYQVLGDGELDIVFVPGVISHLDLLWEDDATADFFRRLASLGRLILFDKRDTGLSDSSRGDATLEERIDDVHAVMAACGCDNAVLFGYSEGGPMSIMFAATHPGRVRALILGAAAARWASAPDYPCGRESDETIDTLEQIARHRWGTGDTIDLYVPTLANSTHARRLLARYERMSASPSAFLRTLRLIRQIDVRPLLPSIHVPTLVIQRLQDRITPPFHGRYLAEHIPDSRYFEQPGDHAIRFASSGDTDALLEEIQDFLGSVDLPSEPNPVLATILVALTSSDGGTAGDVDHESTSFVRHSVEAHRGRLIRGTGDPDVATFDGPGRALRCAAALRDAANAHGVEIRVGVHTGEVETLEGAIVGPAVAVAHRIAALARPSEILATRVVKDLVSGAGVTFRDYAPKTETGFDEPHRPLTVQDV